MQGMILDVPCNRLGDRTKDPSVGTGKRPVVHDETVAVLVGDAVERLSFIIHGFAVVQARLLSSSKALLPQIMLLLAVTVAIALELSLLTASEDLA